MPRAITDVLRDFGIVGSRPADSAPPVAQAERGSARTGLNERIAQEVAALSKTGTVESSLRYADAPQDSAQVLPEIREVVKQMRQEAVKQEAAQQQAIRDAHRRRVNARLLAEQGYPPDTIALLLNDNAPRVATPETPIPTPTPTVERSERTERTYPPLVASTEYSPKQPTEKAAVYDGVPKVLIGVPCDYEVMEKAFVKSLWNLDKPEGTVLEIVRGFGVAEMRNELALKALKGGFTHLFMLDADMLYPKDTMTRLLERDKDIVSGLSCRRRVPHQRIYPQQPEPFDPRDPYMTKNEPPPFFGCHRTYAVGGAATLIRTVVFEKMRYPYFRLDVYGQNGERVGEDIYFSVEAGHAGFECWIDCDVRTGHIVKGVVWAEVDEVTGEWRTVHSALDA